MGGFFGPKWFKFAKNWAQICAQLGQPGRFFAKNRLWTYLASPLDAPGAKTPIFFLFFTIFATGMGVGTPVLATLGPARGKVSALPPQTTLQLCSQAASPWAVFATSLEESILGRKPLWFVSFDRLGAYGRISSHTNMVRVGLGLGLGCIHQKSTLLAHVGACYQDQLGGLGVRAHGPDRQRGVRRVVETSG